jgi:prepilin-type N-terminal cleavage/methylation domain-containing protein
MKTLLHRTNGSEAGLTLLEVLAALVILSTSLMAVLLIRNRSVHKAANAQGLMKAVQLAELKLNEFALHGYPQSDLQAPFPEHPGFAWATHTEQVTVPGKASIYRVDLVVTYPSLGQSVGTYRVTTAFSKETEE